MSTPATGTHHTGRGRQYPRRHRARLDTRQPLANQPWLADVHLRLAGVDVDEMSVDGHRVPAYAGR